MRMFLALFGNVGLIWWFGGFGVLVEFLGALWFVVLGV